MRYVVFGFVDEKFERRLNMHPNLTIKNLRGYLIPELIRRVNIGADDVIIRIILPNATIKTVSDHGPIGNLMTLSEIKSLLLGNFSSVKDDQTLRLRFSVTVERK